MPDNYLEPGTNAITKFLQSPEMIKFFFFFFFKILNGLKLKIFFF